MSDSDKKKKYLSKSGRWIVPTGGKKPVKPDPGQPLQQTSEQTPQQAPVHDENKVQDTISQIDLDIPGMVVLTSKEDRHLGRLNQDMKAKETFRYENPNAQNDTQEVDTAENSSDATQSLLTGGDMMLLDLLLQKEVIDHEGHELSVQAVNSYGYSISEALVQQELMKPDELGTFVASECRVPFSRLEILRVHKNALGIVTRNDIAAYQVIPLSRIGKTLNIATVNPMENPLIERLKQESGYDVKCIVCTPAALSNTMKQYYG